MARLVQDLTVGAFVPGDSLLHRLDPRTKLVGLAVMLASVFLDARPAGVAAGAAAALALASVSGIGLRLWVESLRRFLWLLVITAAVNALFHGSGTPLMIGSLQIPVTAQGVVLALVFTTQVATAIMLSMTLTFTTAPTELARSLQRLSSPLKRLGIPVDQIGLTVLLALRFLPLLQEELRTILDAQKSRGIDFSEGGIAVRTEGLIAVLYPCLIAAFRRADNLALAMVSRGFDPTEPRSEFRPLRFAGRDWAALACPALFLLIRVSVLH
jgi:energy-coupling factor transport system permease protein